MLAKFAVAPNLFFARPLSAVVSQVLLGALPPNSFVNCACSAFASLTMLEHFHGRTFRHPLPRSKTFKTTAGAAKQIWKRGCTQIISGKRTASFTCIKIKRIELAPVSAHIWASYFKNNGPPLFAAEREHNKKQMYFRLRGNSECEHRRHNDSGRKLNNYTSHRSENNKNQPETGNRIGG